MSHCTRSTQDKILNVGDARLLAQAGTSPNWQARFLDEAPKNWEQYRVASSRLQGSVSSKIIKEEPARKIVVESDLVFRQGAGGAYTSVRILSSNQKAKTGNWDLYCANSKYRFAVRRHDELTPWTLVSINAPTVGEDHRTPIHPHQAPGAAVLAMVNAPIAINFNMDDDWRSMLASADFKLISVAASDKNGSMLVKVGFDLRWLPTEQNPIRVVKRGYAWFYPDKLWVMQKCEYQMQRGPNGVIKEHSATYEYENAKDTIPLLKRVVICNFGANKQLFSTESTDLALTFADVPETDFTLTAFGLPEPVGIAWPKPTRWYLWIITAAAAALILAFSFRLLKRRFRISESVKQ